MLLQCALKAKWKSGVKKAHWLDHASDKYGQRLIEDIKMVLRVLVLYLPLPFFWALFDQQVYISVNSYIFTMIFLF